MIVMKPIELSEKDKRRFWSKVAPPNDAGCMLWTAGTGIDGRYGRIQIAGKAYYAHRVAYVIAHDQQIAEKAVIDHKCRVTLCVNPEHLHHVTTRENSQNRKGAQVGAASGIRGVNWNPNHKMWVVRVGHEGVRHFGGYFDNVDDAEQAAINLRNVLYTNNLVDRQGPGE